MASDWDNIDSIDKKFIFRFVSQEQIFEKYLNIPIDDDFHINPLRSDAREGCKYFYDSKGRLWFVDFSREKSYDCFNVVETIYRCNYYTACRIIANDFGLLDFNKPKVEIKTEEVVVKTSTKVVIRVKRKKFFSKEALAFWEQFKLNLTRDELINELYVAGIYPLDGGWLEYPDGCLKMIYDYNKYKPAFYYPLDDTLDEYNYQLYFPYNSRDKVRFMQSRNDLLHNYKQLPKTGDYVLITKSKKDVFLALQFGIPTTGIISERSMPSEQIMSDLAGRFTTIFTLFDRDRTGMILSIKMRDKYQTVPLLTPKGTGKDFADALLEMGVESMIDLIEETKQYYNL